MDDKSLKTGPRKTETVLREAPKQPDPGSTTKTDGKGDPLGRKPDQEAG